MIAQRLILGCLLFAASLASADEKDALPNYLPFKTGSKWTYSLERGGMVKKLFMQLSKVETIDGVVLARLDSTLAGRLSSEHYSNTKDGLFRNRIFGIDIAPPLRLIRYPVRDGDTWEATSKLGEVEIKSTCKVGKETIETPAGKFETVRIAVHAVTANTPVDTVYWFAPEIGIVQQTIDQAGNHAKMKLESFEVGK